MERTVVVQAVESERREVGNERGYADDDGEVEGVAAVRAVERASNVGSVMSKNTVTVMESRRE